MIAPVPSCRCGKMKSTCSPLTRLSTYDVLAIRFELSPGDGVWFWVDVPNKAALVIEGLRGGRKSTFETPPTTLVLPSVLSILFAPAASGTRLVTVWVPTVWVLKKALLFTVRVSTVKFPT